MRGPLTAVAAIVLAAAIACAPALRSTATAPPTPVQVAELWQEPADLESRDLFHGPGGPSLAPAADAVWRYTASDTTGYSRGYDVTGADGSEWDVKLGPEAQTEVVASRFLWAVGYHQPPTYFVARWRLMEAPGVDESVPQGSARFRPDMPGMTNMGDWSWPRRWFVVRDLGAAFGKSRGYFPGTRNNPGDYERQEFIVGVREGRVVFAYGGRHRGLLQRIKPADVVWICERLARLSDRQWADAFRAAGYAEQVKAQLRATIERHIAQGLALSDSPKVSAANR